MTLVIWLGEHAGVDIRVVEPFDALLGITETWGEGRSLITLLGDTGRKILLGKEVCSEVDDRRSHGYVGDRIGHSTG